MSKYKPTNVSERRRRLSCDGQILFLLLWSRKKLECENSFYAGVVCLQQSKNVVQLELDGIFFLICFHRKHFVFIKLFTLLNQNEICLRLSSKRSPIKSLAEFCPHTRQLHSDNFIIARAISLHRHFNISSNWNVNKQNDFFNLFIVWKILQMKWIVREQVSAQVVCMFSSHFCEWNFFQRKLIDGNKLASCSS